MPNPSTFINSSLAASSAAILGALIPCARSNCLRCSSIEDFEPLLSADDCITPLPIEAALATAADPTIAATTQLILLTPVQVYLNPFLLSHEQLYI